MMFAPKSTTVGFDAPPASQGTSGMGTMAPASGYIETDLLLPAQVWHGLPSVTPSAMPADAGFGALAPDLSSWTTMGLAGRTAPSALQAHSMPSREPSHRYVPYAVPEPHEPLSAASSMPTHALALPPHAPRDGAPAFSARWSAPSPCAVPGHARVHEGARAGRARRTTTRGASRSRSNERSDVDALETDASCISESEMLDDDARSLHGLASLDAAQVYVYGVSKRSLEKRRRRRESHNAVERRRRDHINSQITERTCPC